MDAVFLVIGTFIAGIGLTASVNTLRILSAPMKKISSAEGNSTIRGKISEDSAIILSPITKTKCVYCSYRTFERGAKFHQKARGIAQVVAGSGVKNSSFFLEDETDKIRVSEKGQLLYGGSAHTNRVYDESSEYKNQVTEFKNSTNIGEGEEREYEESLLMIGDIINIHGEIKNEGGQRIIYPDAMSFKKISDVALAPVGIFITIMLVIAGTIIMALSL